MTYQTFAHVYDEVMDHEQYQLWVEFTKDSFKTYTSRNIQKVMELACGTGEVSTLLTEAGYQVTGVDLSREMLDIAKEKYQQDYPSIDWVQKDMRDLKGLETFDAITLYSDSLCYLTEFEDTIKVFKTVYEHLKEGGLFLFDVHSLYQMQEVFPGYQYHYTSENLAFLWQSYELEEPGSVEHVIDMFVRDESQTSKVLFEHFQEVHVEQTFPMEWYQEALEMVGFKKVWIRANFGESEVEETSPRWFFIALK